jgi:hypothetical protein
MSSRIEIQTSFNRASDNRYNADEVIKGFAYSYLRLCRGQGMKFASQLKPGVGRVAGGPEEAATRAGLVATQMLGLALCRYVLRFPPVVALGTGEIVEWYGPTVQRNHTD